MAKTSMKVKQQMKPKFSTRAYTRCKICGRPHSVLKKYGMFSTRAYTRCKICGRPHSVLKKYGICRICFRELAYKGQIPGVKKASW